MVSGVYLVIEIKMHLVVHLFQLHRFRVHTVLDKFLKVLEFCFRNSGPLKVLENRVGPSKYLKVLEF